MPTRVFTELDEAKKQRVTDAALAEFASCGYESASTNNIVKECGISKGSLFKYFENKEDLYFYLIDTVAAKMASDMAPLLEKLPADLYERIKAYSSAEISWYMEHPVEGAFMTRMASERGEIEDKLNERYKSVSNDTYKALLKGADLKKINHDKKKVIKLLGWVLQGFNRSFLEKEAGSKKPMKKLREEYGKQLADYLDILRKGL